MAIFEHFSRQIKLSLKVAKIILLENFFLQQVTFIYDCNIMQKKVGVTRGRVTSSGLPPPLVGIGLDAIVKKLYHLFKEKVWKFQFVITNYFWLIYMAKKVSIHEI